MYKKNAKIQNPKPDCWERIEALSKWSGLTIDDLNHHLRRYTRENLYEIKSGNSDITLNMAGCICCYFPEINKLWLLTGEGQMLKEPQNITPWVYFAGSALSALISKGVDMPEVSAANYADHLVEIYTQKGGKQ